MTVGKLVQGGGRGDRQREAAPVPEKPRAAMRPAMRFVALSCLLIGSLAPVVWAEDPVRAVGSEAGDAATSPPNVTGRRSFPPLPAYLGGVPSWVDGARCGPNSLYVMLQLLGISADIDALAERCRIQGEQGCSILDLQRVAAEYGVEAEVRYVSPAAMPQLQMPFIAHLSPGDERSPAGHFLVVFDYRVADGNVSSFGVIDGTSGNHSYRDAGVLARSYSGYVLVPKDRTRSWLIRSFAGGLMIVIAVLAWQAWMVRLRRTPMSDRRSAGGCEPPSPRT